MIRQIATILFLSFITTLASAQSSAVGDLSEFLKRDASAWTEIAAQPFAKEALSKSDSEKAEALLVEARRAQLLQERADEMKALEITIGDKKMPFFFKTYGDKPKGGRSLFISMHGGGGAPKRVNDSQWNNQKRLYKPEEGVYVAPRAPTDTWNLWHEKHIMPMFDRLIENMILFEDVNPDRVYVMGYSAGGDGVYQLAPRMADRWAAAAMMAGHPNDAKPLNLRNIGFALYMGGKDSAYKRNEVAAEWGKKLAKLEKDDPGGYKHLVTIYPEKRHWMDGEDASAVPWMSKFVRNTSPTKIIWRKDGNAQPRFYWLGASTDNWQSGEVITAERKDSSITLSDKPSGLSLLLSDNIANLDADLNVAWKDKQAKVTPKRTVAAIHQSLSERFDPSSIYSCVIDCDAL